MKLLKKRPIAIIITLCVICLSTIFSAHRTLGAACREVEDGFYTGVYDAEWKSSRKSIRSQLDKRQEAASTLLSIAANLEEVSQEVQLLFEAREALAQADTIPQQFAANKTLDSAFHNLVSALSELSLDERNMQIVDKATTNFRGAQSVIRNAGYNETVRAFHRDTLDVFPTNVIRTIAMIEAPALFE